MADPEFFLPDDPSVCPLCGEPNECGHLKPRDAFASDQCWCMKEIFDPKALKLVPEAARGKACICRTCALGGKSK